MKLHPLSIPYRTGESVLRLAWLLLFVVIGSAVEGGSAVAFVVLAGFVVAVAYQFVYYRRFEYELTADSLDIASGVVSRRNREIPVGRIQNVDISRNVVQRLLGLAVIDLETAGGSSTEASLNCVSETEAMRLQEEIGRLKRGDASEIGTPAERDREELFAVTPKELVLLGVVGVDLRLLSIVTVVLPVIAPSLRERFADPLVGLAVTAPLAALVVVGVTAAISGVLAVTNYYGFRLSRGTDELHYERGLLQRYSGTIPLEKVQTLAVSENVIARRLGYASLAVETAGYASGESGQQSAIPLAERDRVFALGDSVESFRPVSFQRPPKRARQRYTVRYAAVALGVVAATFAVDRGTSLSFAWYVTAALLPAAPVAAHLKWANLGYDVQAEYVVLREGFWTRTTTVVPYYRVQTVLDSRTVFQRRRQLATLVVDTARSGGLTGGQPRALDIDADRAASLLETVADRLQASLVRRRDERRAERIRSIESGGPDASA
jgi:putative membrane protein